MAGKILSAECKRVQEINERIANGDELVTDEEMAFAETHTAMCAECAQHALALTAHRVQN